MDPFALVHASSRVLKAWLVVMILSADMAVHSSLMECFRAMVLLWEIAQSACSHTPWLGGPGRSGSNLQGARRPLTRTPFFKNPWTFSRCVDTGVVDSLVVCLLDMASESSDIHQPSEEGLPCMYVQWKTYFNFKTWSSTYGGAIGLGYQWCAKPPLAIMSLTSGQR